MRSPARSCCGSHSSLAMRSSSQPRVRHTAAFAWVTWQIQQSSLANAGRTERFTGMLLPASKSSLTVLRILDERVYAR